MIAPRVIRSDVDRLIDLAFVTSDSYRAMKKRAREFPSAMAMELAAIATDPTARRYFESELDELFKPRKRRPPKEPVVWPEVIVGGGIHAAIYATARVAAGKPMPLVIERERIGGVFAQSTQPAFWLNSRNRPGEGGLPSENAALNAIPGAPVQMSHMSSLEFQSNADLAFIARVMLARSAVIKAGVEVYSVAKNYDEDPAPYQLFLSDGTIVNTSRVIDARGLGNATKLFGGAGSDRVFTFTEFLRRLESPFPLQGMKRVAVIGDGDSARVTVEALLGQGPAHMSVAALDWVEQVDWYAQGVYTDCGTFQDTERGRYSRLGSFLTPVANGIQRLRVLQQRGQARDVGDRVQVNGRLYDHVIGATGWNRESIIDYDYFEGEFSPYPNQGEVGGQFGRRQEYAEVYAIGPAADLPFDGYEISNSASRLPQNQVALFRLGWRTAALAGVLS